MRPPSFWSGSICHLPPTRGGTALEDGVSESITGLIPPSLCSCLLFLSIASEVPSDAIFTLGNAVFRSFFSKKARPSDRCSGGAPVKTYSAQSGYVYQYFYEGHRPFRAAAKAASSLYSRSSADRKSWHPLSVLVGERRCPDGNRPTRPRAVFHRAICDCQTGVVSGLRRTGDAGPDEAGRPRAPRRCGSDHFDFGILGSHSLTVAPRIEVARYAERETASHSLLVLAPRRRSALGTRRPAGTAAGEEAGAPAIAIRHSEE